MHLRPLLLLLLAVRTLGAPADDMASAAKTFLAALTPEQKTKAAFVFASPERENWHFIPKDRNGLPLKEMSAAQLDQDDQRHRHLECDAESQEHRHHEGQAAVSMTWRATWYCCSRYAVSTTLR